MSEAAEQVLSYVLEKYGSSSCDTPQMLETLLRKHGRACPKEVGVLITALRTGIITDLRAEKDPDPTALARVLALQGHVPQAQADWAVAAWSAALARAPMHVSTPDRKNGGAPSAVVSPARAATVLLMAAATGIFAYLTFGR
ncbi:MAG TPA: hypothetical protein VH120_09010 [Gemmataceae bacterium]|jgi:hypothetical protein|nr:hypothetical protein [Gemmataceae bacterium]